MTAQLAPFQPRGTRPEWRVIFEDVLAGCDFGDLITFDQLDEALGRDFRSSRGPLYRAAEELLATRNRTLASVPGKGYRVAQPNEHADLAQKDHLFGRRRISRALRKATHVDKAKLTADERAAVERLELGYRRHEAMLRRLSDKVARQEAAITAHSAELDHTVDQLGEIREQVARLQQALEQRGFLNGKEQA